jgi:hypothetical protein
MPMKSFNLRGLEIRQAILQHIQGFWPNSTIAEEAWPDGPIKENVPGLRVLRVNSKTPERPVIYVTNGCFLVEPTHIRHEFFLISARQESQHVETLTMLTNFHADKRYRLDVGSVVNIGGPWMQDSSCDHLLISIPYPYGPKLEWLKLPDICIRFLWALPITPREAAFIELNGSSALEERFETAKLDYIDPSRSSTV